MATRTKATKPKLAPADRLKREIQAVLTEDLRSDEHRLGHGRYDGFAYPAAEAYFHLAGGHAAGLRPTHLKHRGKSHWWLLDSEGRVIDLTLAPRETSNFPYYRGKRRPFRYTPSGLSRRAQAIVDKVNAGATRSVARNPIHTVQPGRKARERALTQ